MTFDYVTCIDIQCPSMNFSSMGDKKPTTGSAGAIKAAGGGFAKMEVAHEEEYFYKQVN